MYTFDGRIRYSEVDRRRKLTAEKTIDYFQDCTSFQSEDLGIGLDYMAERGIAWVINYWQIHFYRRPVMGESVRTGTQPYEFKRKARGWQQPIRCGLFWIWRKCILSGFLRRS